MVRTEVGYAGGSTPNPTYHAIGDHAEAVDLRFDPDVLSFDALLERFWRGHDPTFPGRGQYRAAVYCHDDLQWEKAEATRAALLREHGAVATEVVRDAPYYPAEGYHQKWRLRRCPKLWSELEAAFSQEAELLASATAAKLNGLVGGRVSDGEIERWIDRLGLSERGRAILLKGGG